VELLFCGVRGSTPVSGAEFLRTGGNTSCVALRARDALRPHLVLDAGTGLQRLAREFAGEAFVGTILLTHLHWDHVQGLPFFAPADRADARTTLWMPAQDESRSGAGEDARAVLARALSPPHFPISPDGLCGEWSFRALAEGEHTIESLSIVAREIPHKGGRTFGYRVSDGITTIAYLPDHGPVAGVSPSGAAVELARGVDVLVHGGQFLASEQEIATAYGHATVDDALQLAQIAQIRTLILTHHSPARDDDAVDAIVADASARAGAIRVLGARDGLRLEVGASRASA